MSTTIKELKSIPENPPRWKPSSDPASIIVPGLDTTASVTDQIDQIDQLITLKLQVGYACHALSIVSVLIFSPLSLLQNIDADFSRMQQVLSNRILPAFKRYSIGTEPAREAAKVSYACVYLTYSCHDTFFPSSGHPFMSRLPRSAYQLPMTYLLYRIPHLVWPWRRNPTYPLALKICPLHRDSMLIRSTQIVHPPKVHSSPHKPRSPPRQQQRLRGHGEQMTPH